MADFLRNFDRLSFWLGFLAASLLLFVLGRLRPFFVRVAASMRTQRQATRHQRSLGDEVRLSNDMLRLVQSMHVAAPLFSLDEVLIPPRLIAPAVAPMAYEPPLSEDITDWAIPPMPDWPELGSFYGAPWLSPAEALQHGIRLVISGQPGTGKTVALAAFAAQLARQTPEVEHLGGCAPLMVHAADLALSPPRPEDPVASLAAAVSKSTKSIRAKRLPVALKNLLKQGRIILLLDGLDELPPAPLSEISGYLRELLKHYPDLRIVAAADPDNLDGLLAMGFQNLPLASWSQAQRALFISRWSDLWERFVSSSHSGSSSTDPMILVGWLLNNSANLTPLEITLKVWATFAGDSLGPGPVAAIEAYLRRMMASQPARNRPAFQQMAAQMVLASQPFADRQNVERWLGGADISVASDEAAPVETEAGETVVKGGKPEVVRARGALPDLIERGLIISHAGERLRIAHPLFAGYLAAQALAGIHGGAQVAAQPDWVGKSVSLNYLAILEGQPGWLSDLLKSDEMDPVLRGVLTAGRWLRTAPEGQPWVIGLMRSLTSELQKDRLPVGLRARVLTAMLASGNSGLPVLLRRMLETPQPDTRHLAILGLGFLRDTKSVPEIGRLVYDPLPPVSRSAILALTAIGDKTGLESVASALVHGDEIIRRAAAEGLANHPEEGHPTLEEGASVQDAGVRRAVVFGLGRVRQPWATTLIEKIAAEDPMWVVQDAANQVLKNVSEPHPRAPRPLPALPQTAWLIAFAAERGMGVSPGKPAYEMLFKALREGSEDQRMAALYYLGHNPDESAVLPLYQVYYSEFGEIQELAFQALSNLAASGVTLPSPTQYGLK